MSSKILVTGATGTIGSFVCEQLKAINDWRGTHIEDTYISVSKSNRDCDFASNWLKK